MTIEETKNMYRDIVARWNSTDPEVIASKWGVSRVRVAMIAGKLRKAGLNLAAKPRIIKRMLDNDFLSELKNLPMV